MTKSVLILGASGRFGSNCLQAFKAAGWVVKTYQRDTNDMAKAAQGVDVIVNGLNPPYQLDWQALLPVMAKQIVEAAKSSGASIIQPGNVYNFGAYAGEWGATTAQTATTRKGKARIEMEQIFHEAAKQYNIQTIIIRAGDFIDTTPSGNYFDIMTAKIEKGKVSYPGNPNIPHAWAYLPDLARVVVALAERKDTLAKFEDIPFSGFTLTGNALIKTLETASGTKLKMTGFPWWFFKVAAPFSRLFKALLEMRYLWDTAHSLNGQKLIGILPEYRDTETVNALKNALP